MDPVEQLLADLDSLTAEQRSERLRALTADELAALGERLAAMLEEARQAEPSDESIASIRRITECAQAAGEVVAEREAEAERLRTEHEAALAEAETALNGEQEQPETPEGEQQGEPPAEGEQAPATETPPPPPPPPPPAEGQPSEGEQTPQAVAAAAPPARVPLNRVRRPERHDPTPTNIAQQALVAAVGVEGGDAQGRFRDLEDVGVATSRLAHRMLNGRHDGMAFSVAKVLTPYPEERTLKAEDPEGNKRKMDAVMGPKAIAAAGGPCGTFPMNYAITGLGTENRPVLGTLADFGGERGGVNYRQGPVIGDYAAGISHWTLDTDTAAATDDTLRKPCIRLQCGDVLTAEVEAIVKCGTVGNVIARTDPETVAEFWRLLSVEYAREAESTLLRKMGDATFSTHVTTDQLLGAVLDMLNAIDLGIVAIRDTHRMGDNERLEAIFPRWLRTLMKIDIARQMPAGSWQERFRVADAEITTTLETRENLSVVWALDTEDGATFSPQSTGGLVNYPDQVTWLLHPVNTFGLVSLPELDLGLTRDSTLNAANDFSMFMEGFEGVARPGTVSYRMTSTICPSGASSGTIDPDLVCAAEGS